MAQAGFAEWLHGYREAWEDMDPEAAGALFTADARYRVTPFDQPFEGRQAIEEYWAEATAGQDDPSVEVEVITEEGDRGVGHFRAAFTDDDGEAVVLDGVCVVTLDGSVATEFIEWWHMEQAG